MLLMLTTNDADGGRLGRAGGRYTTIELFNSSPLMLPMMMTTNVADDDQVLDD